MLFCVKIGGKEVSVKAADAAEVAGGLDFMNHVDAVFCHMLVVSFWKFEEVGLTLDSLGPVSSRMYL